MSVEVGLRNVRKFESMAQLPIIVSTANVAEGIRDEVLGMGANDFIAKPYDLEALLEMIKAYLDPKTPDPQPPPGI